MELSARIGSENFIMPFSSGIGNLSIYDVGEQYVAIQNDTHIDFYPFTSIDHIEIW